MMYLLLHCHCYWYGLFSDLYSDIIMPISKKMNNLLQASKAACHTASWHIVLAISAGGNHVTEEPVGMT